MNKEQADKYCRNGDRIGYLVASFKEKLSIKNKRGILDITDEEFKAWESSNRLIIESLTLTNPNPF